MEALTRRQPWSVLKAVKTEVDPWFAGHFFLKSENDMKAANPWSPPMDIREEPDKFVFTTDLPGVNPKEIKVLVEDGALIIQGERTLETKVDEKQYFRMERASGSFYRKFSLPDKANVEQITAKSKHGVLEIQISKKTPNVPKGVEVQIEEN